MAINKDRTLLLLLPLLLALTPISLSPQKPESSPDPKPVNQTQTLARNYVVRFRDYKIAADHQSYLEENLQSLHSWRWIERKNPAMAFPTDFGVLEIKESDRMLVIEEIERLGRVKDVNLDTTYARSLFVDEERFVDGRKKPGKLFTAMSFDDGEGAWIWSPLSNASINWKRKILMQRSQVTSLFGADRLWKKGFTGAKVKMAIFDTGIRANHPHFRNIKERTNWTTEDTLNDNLGHGTFVAGVIAGEDDDCLGFAPDTEIYAFRVFTDAQPWSFSLLKIVMTSICHEASPTDGFKDTTIDLAEIRSSS